MQNIHEATMSTLNRRDKHRLGKIRQPMSPKGGRKQIHILNHVIVAIINDLKLENVIR